MIGMQLGIIQEVKVYNMGNSLTTIWFEDSRIRDDKERSVINFDYQRLKETDFKVSDVLINTGFLIQDPEQFDKEVKHLFKVVVPRDFPDLVLGR
jgi:hypothetical protein